MELEMDFNKCFCKNQEMRVLEEIKCVKCKVNCHQKCYQVSPLDNFNDFYCLKCRLQISEPFLKIKKFVLPPCQFYHKGTYQINFQLDDPEYQNLKQNSAKFTLVIYCMNIKYQKDKKQTNYIFYEWPSDNIVISLNKHKLIYHIPYPSSINPALLHNPDKKINNCFQYEINQNLINHAVIGIYFAEIQKISDVSQMILEYQFVIEEQIESGYLSWDLPYKQITSDLEAHILLRDPLNSKSMNIPVKGAKCNHLSFFDLENYLKLYEKVISTERRWKCPSCGNIIYWTNIKVDFFIYDIISQLKQKHVTIKNFENIKEIVLNQKDDGSISYQERYFDENGQNQSESDMDEEETIENTEKEEGGTQKQVKQLDISQHLNRMDKIQILDEIQRNLKIEMSKKNMTPNVENFISLIKQLPAQDPFFNEMSPIEGVIFFYKLYNKINERLLSQPIDVYRNQSETKSLEEVFQEIYQKEFYQILATYALTFSQTIDVAIRFLLLLVSQKQEEVFVNLEQDIKAKKYSQAHQILIMLLTLAQHLTVNQEYYDKFKEELPSSQNQASIYGFLIMKFLTIYELKSNLQIGKILQILSTFLGEFFAFGYGEDTQLSPEQMKKINNSIEFLYQICKHHKKDIEEEFVPFLQIIFEPPQMPIQNQEEIKKTIQFLNYLKCFISYTFFGTRNLKKVYDKIKAQFEQIVQNWDEEQELQTFLTKNKLTYKDFNDYFKQ